MILTPGEYFGIVRQLPNHLDASTYYVQAVIRNSRTDAVIDTVNLTDKGSQRFHYAWQVPQETSGQGIYITIVTSVYEDSGYTTKSANYGDTAETYFIGDRWQQAFGGGGGGVDISYDKVRSVVREEIASAKEQPITREEITNIVRNIVSEALGRLPEPVADLGPLDDLASQFGARLASLEEALNGVRDADKAVAEEWRKEYEDLKNELVERISEVSQRSEDSFAKNENMRKQSAQQTQDHVKDVVEEVVSRHAKDLVKRISSFKVKGIDFNFGFGDGKPEKKEGYSAKDLL